MTEQKKKRPKPISVTFNPHNSQVIVLCDDGSLWARVAALNSKTMQYTEWEWSKLDQFTSE